MKTSLKRVLMVFLSLSILCASFVGYADNALNQGKSKAARTVVDMTDATIELPETVSTVFCDWPSGITLIMTLGATRKLVAAHTAFDSENFAWAREISPDISSVRKDDAPFTNAEAVLGYTPDVVITNNRENIDKYSNLGLEVVYVDYNSNDSFKESMMIVGAALGEEEKARAEKYAGYFDKNVDLVKERLSDLAENDKPTVYYMDSRFRDAYHTVGTGEIQEDWITVSGGILATKDDFQGRNLEITAEKLLELDPDKILIGAQSQAQVYDLLMSDNVLAGLSAVKNKEVYRIPQGIFPWCRTGAEAAMQVVWSAKLLYPDRFLDIDLVQFAKEFYRDFYGTDVSTESIEGILAGKLSPDSK